MTRTGMTENNPNETPEDNSTTTINQTDIVNEMANVFHEDQVRDDGVETALHCSFPGCNLKFGWWGMRRPFLTTIEDDEAAVKGRCKRATAKALKDLREHHGVLHPTMAHMPREHHQQLLQPTPLQIPLLPHLASAWLDRWLI